MAVLRPLGDRVVVKVLESDEVTAGGIVLPETAQEKSQQGRVVSVGPGRVLDTGERLPVAVEAGQRVVFARYAGTEIELGSEDYMVIREADVLVVLAD